MTTVFCMARNLTTLLVDMRRIFIILKSDCHIDWHTIANYTYIQQTCTQTKTRELGEEEDS